VRSNRTRRGIPLAAGMAAVALTASACGGNGASDANASDNGGGSDSCESISLGFQPAWPDGLSTAWLWKNILEDRGYEVEFMEINDAAPLYAGVAGGDYDVFTSAWSEVAQAAYYAEYGDQVEDLGTWYQNGTLTFTVPAYTDVDSIEDLAGNAAMFDGRIIGIEPGAGMMRLAKEEVMPAYGLTDSYTLVESSTTAMLAELKSAIDAQEDVVVTLWHPYWAYNEFDLKDLEDPKGAWGESEAIHILAREGFSEDCAEAAELMEKLELTDEQYASLEDMVVNEYGQGREGEAIEAWFEENPDVAETLKG
jgi:glycine betaine/proline transport system substrate-binding protein